MRCVGSLGAMVGPSGRQAADANCTVKLPATSLPKDKVKVLLLENINQTAIEIFKAEGFQLVSTIDIPISALALTQSHPEKVPYLWSAEHA